MAAPTASAGLRLSVLWFSPFEPDHDSLRGVLADSRWELLTAFHYQEALTVLRQHDISVVVCDCDAQP